MMMTIGIMIAELIKYSMNNMEQSVNYNYKHCETRNKLQSVIKV